MIACLKERRLGTHAKGRLQTRADGRFDRRDDPAKSPAACPASRSRRPQPRYSTARTWAQTTIIPTNKVIDASAAASSTTARIMMHPPFFEHKGNIVHDTFQCNR